LDFQGKSKKSFQIKKCRCFETTRRSSKGYRTTLQGKGRRKKNWGVKKVPWGIERNSRRQSWGFEKVGLHGEKKGQLAESRGTDQKKKKSFKTA